MNHEQANFMSRFRTAFSGEPKSPTESDLEVCSRNAVAITILRIVVGLFFIVYGQEKVFDASFILRGGFQDGVKGFLSSGSAFPFAIPLLKRVLIRPEPFAYLVAYGELAIGVALVTGVLSRLASTFGLVLMMLLWSCGGFPGPHSAFWMYWASSENWSVLALCFAAMIAGKPETMLSLGKLASRVKQNR